MTEEDENWMGYSVLPNGTVAAVEPVSAFELSATMMVWVVGALEDAILPRAPTYGHELGVSVLSQGMRLPQEGLWQYFRALRLRATF